MYNNGMIVGVSYQGINVLITLIMIVGILIPFVRCGRLINYSFKHIFVPLYLFTYHFIFICIYYYNFIFTYMFNIYTYYNYFNI